MKLNPKEILFGNYTEKKPVLLTVTPPRAGERTLLGVENMLGSIAVPEPFSLELAGDMDGVTLMARCLDDEVVRGQLSAHYPQARIGKVDPDDDPLRMGEGEQAWSMTLRADGPEYVPLWTFRDDDLLDPGSDPLIALMGALSNINKGERVVAQLTGIPQIKPTFLDIAPSGIPSSIIPHSKGVKCGLIRSNSPFSYSNHRPAKPKIPKPLVYAQVSPLGTSFATP